MTMNSTFLLCSFCLALSAAATDFVPNPTAPGSLGQNTNAFTSLYATNVHAQVVTFGDGSTQTTAATGGSGGSGGSGTATNLTGAATNQVAAIAAAQAQGATNVLGTAAWYPFTTWDLFGAGANAAWAATNLLGAGAYSTPGSVAGLSSNTVIAEAAAAVAGSNYVNGAQATNITAAAVALAQTNLSMPQLANRWNIPVPDASWDAALQPNNGATLNNVNLVDDTGNPTNTLIAFPMSGATLPSWNPTIMNGQPGIIVPINQPWSNNVICANGLTNFTFFVVYRDTYQANGCGLFGAGALGTFGLNFVPYELGSPAQNGSDSAWSFSPWALDLGRGSYIHIPCKQNLQVQCACIRAGLTGDPTVWQDGNLFDSVGLNCGPNTTYLTNTFVLSGVPNVNGWYSFYGCLGEAKLYDRALSDQDVQRLMNYYRNRYRMNDREVILGADSIASGSWAAANSNLTHCVNRLLPTYEVVNSSIAGIGSAESYTNLTRNLAQGKWPGGSYYVELCGANDTMSNALGVAESTAFNLFTNYTTLKAQLCASNGINYLPVTHYSTVREEVLCPGFKTNVNNWIYANWQSLGAAGVVDLAANPLIGPLGSYTNGAYILQSDQVHLATNAYPLIYAPAVAQAILGVNSAVKGTFTNSAASFLSSGAFQTMPAAGFVSASVIVTNTQIVWLTNATSHYAVPMGNITGTSTTWDSAVLMVNSGDSVCVTNSSGSGGAQLSQSTFQALK